MRFLLKASLPVVLASLFAGEARADALDDILRAWMRESHVPGIAVAVIREGRIIESRNHGLADIELSAPVTEDSVFEIGSITKMFTAAAVLLLAEDGALAIDDPISRHLTGVPDAWGAVTIRQLLTHSSGIPDYLPVPGLFAATAAPGVSHADIAAMFFERLSPEFQPGETWAYSNSGYLLLGNIIESASGTSYWDFLRERIFEPVGMHATQSSEPAAVVANRVSGYDWRKGRFENRPALTANAYAAGSILSTLGDLALWDLALDSGQLLGPASVGALWTPQRTADGATAPFNYGFGWFVDTFRGRRVVYHSGETPGFSSILHRFPSEKLTVIVLTNRTGLVMDHLAVDIAGLYAPGLARPAVTHPDPDETMTRAHGQALTGLLRGDPNFSLFAPPMRIWLRTENAKGVWSWIGADGELESFSFSERESAGEELILRYRAVLGGTVRWFSFTVTADGAIAQVNWW